MHVARRRLICSTYLITNQTAEPLHWRLFWGFAGVSGILFLVFCNILRKQIFFTTWHLSYLLSEFGHAHFFLGYNTSSRDLLRPPFAKTAKYQGSFRINGARTYNTSPRNIRQVETFSEFKNHTKAPS